MAQKGIRFEVKGDVVEIQLGQSSVRAQSADIDALLHLLKGAQAILSQAPVAHAAAATPAPRPAAPVALPTVVPAPEPSKPRTSKRRSRKRVGDALIVWMDANPGWHTEEELLNVVITHHMTDADPKRALKIALGKQKGDVFETDDNGSWRSASEGKSESRWHLSASEAKSIREKLLG